MAETSLSRSEPPPASTIGAFGWLHRNLFSSPFNIALTVLASYLLYPRSHPAAMGLAGRHLERRQP